MNHDEAGRRRPVRNFLTRRRSATRLPHPASPVASATTGPQMNETVPNDL
jgi:hypothetical protein